MRIPRLLLFLLCCTGWGLGLRANNIQVSNVALSSQAGGSASFTFDLSWENSWRITAGPANWDAAWVFAKVSVNGGAWQPMAIQTVFVNANAADIASLSAYGFMVYRNAPGTGDINWTGLEIVWDYQEAGIDDNADLEVRLFATEMVYVPEGSYTLGNGNADPISGSFVAYNGEFPVFPYQGYPVDAETQLPLFFANSGLSLGYLSDGDGVPTTLPAAFPKGFGAFYTMKYEVSQQQWVDFFNTLTPTQQFNLDVTGPDGKNTDAPVNRNGVSWTTGSDATTSLPNVPINYVPNTYVYAYLDWAGLRPMTELEFEKASRGPLAPVPDEYVWGTTRLALGPYTVTGLGTANELISNAAAGAGNAALSSLLTQPGRCGIFAASAPNPNREETGGTYYGIMDMAGNLYERCISIGDPSSRAFSGQHGDGRLNTNGDANVTGWPISNDTFSFRGGTAGSFASRARTADRSFGNYTGAIDLQSNGIRGVISAN